MLISSLVETHQVLLLQLQQRFLQLVESWQRDLQEVLLYQSV